MKSNKNKIQQDIFHDDQQQQEQEGQVVSSSPNQDYQKQQQQNEQVEEKIQYQVEDMYDSSDDNIEKLQKQKQKRQQLRRQRQVEQSKLMGISPQQLISKAHQLLQKTNKRVMLMRKKNIKRMEDIQKVRMSQQPYLIATNTHFRGNLSEYPVITCDKSRKILFHPNYSLKVSQMKLSDFIQKNIKQQTTANYLNQVVKFQNYAYQQRKKRRQNIQ